MCAQQRLRSAWASAQSLSSVFAVRMKKAWVLSYQLSARRRLWSDCADAQADPSLRWAHSHFIGFVMRLLIYTQTNVDILTSQNQNIVQKSTYLWPPSRMNNIKWLQILLVSKTDNVYTKYEILILWHCTLEWWSIPGLALEPYWTTNEIKTYQPCHDKTSLCHMQTTKVQISLLIRTVWSAPLLFAA